MTNSTGRTSPAKRPDSQVRPKDTTASRRNKPAADHHESAQQLGRAVANLSAEPETMEADNVGLEELIAALTRIRIPRRRQH